MIDAQQPSWYELALTEEVRAERTDPPRQRGVTMVLDAGRGISETQDLLDVAGRWIDHWKLTFGTSAFVPEDVLRHKLEVIGSAGILTFPGGTMFEAAIVHHHCRVYMQKAHSLGFRAVEVSDGTIDLPRDRRRRVIECALDADLTVISEVGKKDPDRRMSPGELAEQACLDLEWGSSWVVVEGRESGAGVGVFDASGEVDTDAVEEIAREMGSAADQLVWEAPRHHQQKTLIERFGLNVNLGNIDPGRVLALEALRCGVRFESLRPIAERMMKSGEWQPDQMEADEGDDGTDDISSPAPAGDMKTAHRDEPRSQAST